MAQNDFNLTEFTLGIEFVQLMNAWKDAELTLHSGANRPEYAVAGTLWLKDISATEKHLMWYAGGDNDIKLMELDTSTSSVKRDFTIGEDATAERVQGKQLQADSLQTGVLQIAGDANVRKIYQGQEKTRAMQVSLVDTLPTAILGPNEHLDATHLLAKNTGRIHEIDRTVAPENWKITYGGVFKAGVHEVQDVLWTKGMPIYDDNNKPTDAVDYKSVKGFFTKTIAKTYTCLLYTSDAADE